MSEFVIFCIVLVQACASARITWKAKTATAASRSLLISTCNEVVMTATATLLESSTIGCSANLIMGTARE